MRCRACSRSTRPRTTRRFDFRSCTWGRLSSRTPIPTYINREPRPRCGSVQGRRDLFLGERLDHVAGLQVLEAVEPDAAVEAGADLRGVVLEPLERDDLALVHHAA